MKERVTDFQDLPCRLTEDELKQETQKLVALEQELVKQEASKKAQVAEINAVLKQTKASIADSVKTLSTGEVVRSVEVEKRYRYADKVCDWVRLDTNEVVQSLPMDAFDLQESLELEGGEEPLPPPSKPQKRRKRGELYEVQDDV